MRTIRWRLREELETRGISVYRLARRLDGQVSRTGLHEISRGSTKGVDFEKLAAIMYALAEESGRPVAFEDVLEWQE